jgi:riboflavin synthase
MEKGGAITRIGVFTPGIARDVRLGQSVSVNGVCLTVVKKEKNLLSFEVMRETCKRTNLGVLKPGEKVNLERALKADARIDGHFVTGHIDGTGRISRRYKRDGDIILDIETDSQILGQIVLKGSVALDGISLTGSGLKNRTLSVGFITYTIQNTIVKSKKIRDKVNIECDVLGKYTRNLFSHKGYPSSRLSVDFLRKHGFAPA